MVDTASWPPKPRRIGAIARFTAYSLACLVGIDVVHDVPTNPQEHAGAGTILILGAVAAVAGFAAAVGVAFRRWRVEFRAIGALGGALLVYNVIDWTLVLFVDPEMPLRGPAIVGVAFCMLVYRGAGLYVFSLTARHTKSLRRGEGQGR